MEGTITALVSSRRVWEFVCRSLSWLAPHCPKEHRVLVPAWQNNREEMINEGWQVDWQQELNIGAQSVSIIISQLTFLLRSIVIQTSDGIKLKVYRKSASYMIFKDQD